MKREAWPSRASPPRATMPQTPEGLRLSIFTSSPYPAGICMTRPTVPPDYLPSTESRTTEHTRTPIWMAFIGMILCPRKVWPDLTIILQAAPQTRKASSYPHLAQHTSCQVRLGRLLAGPRPAGAPRRCCTPMNSGGRAGWVRAIWASRGCRFRGAPAMRRRRSCGARVRTRPARCGLS
jgi:hypothetical protein